MTLAQGPRSYIEKAFTTLLQAAFAELEYPKWHSDPANSDLDISVGISVEEIERLPRITVTLGDVQDQGSGGFGNLAEWTDVLKRYVYVEQALVSITCYSSVADEAADMAYHCRRMIHSVRDQLRAKGFMGLQTFTQSQPQPNQFGQLSDHIYAVDLRCPVLFVSNDVIGQGQGLPWFKGWKGVGGDPLPPVAPDGSSDDPSAYIPSDPENPALYTPPSPVDVGGARSYPVSSEYFFTVRKGQHVVSGDGILLKSRSGDATPVVLNRVEKKGDQVVMTFSADLGPYQPIGFAIKQGETVLDAFVSRSPYRANILIVDFAEPASGYITIQYENGNLKTVPGGSLLPNFSVLLENV